MEKYCLCTCVNDRFVKGAEIMIYSFLKNNTWFDGDIVILCGSENWPMHLSEENRDRLSNIYYKTIVKDYKFSDFSIVVDEIKRFATKGLEPLLFKLPLFSLEEYDRVLFVDSDMLVVGDVKEFFEGKGGAITVCLDRVCGERREWGKREQEYFNAGVFSVSKEFLSKYKYEDILRFPQFYDLSIVTKWNPFGGIYVDQDIFNCYFLDKDVDVAPSIYNFPRAESDRASEVGDTRIIHYLGSNKPWEVSENTFSYNLWKSYENDYEEWLTCYRLRWGEIVRNYPKKYEDKDKYVVFTCAKNENKYIVEWVNHYLNLGFDKIFVCDNNDDESLCDVLSDYINNGTVERFDCHKMILFQDGVNKMFIENGNFKWCGLFDCDEFLELGVYDNIKDYLAAKDEDCVAFNWLIYGSNGQKRESDKPLKERFTKPTFPIINVYNSFLKCIVRGGHFRYRDALTCGGHLPICGNKMTYNIGGYYKLPTIPRYFQSAMPLRYKEGYIRHYYTKSFDEWINKARRGWPDHKGTLPYHRFFFLEDKERLDKKDYDGNLFINSETFERLSAVPLEAYKSNTVILFNNDTNILYAFVTRLMYIMSKVEGKTLIVTGDFIDDMAFTLLLECGFATGNRVVYADNLDTELKAFYRYKNPDDEYNLLMEIKI